MNASETDPSRSAMPATLFERIGGLDVIRPLLRRFYADVRQHAEIGPIFDAMIDDWPAHREKIAGFWSTVTGGPVAYAGPMFQVHQQLPLRPEHFAAWLELWARHCRIHLPAEAAEDMIQIARMMARRLGAPAGVHLS